MVSLAFFIFRMPKYQICWNPRNVSIQANLQHNDLYDIMFNVYSQTDQYM